MQPELSTRYGDGAVTAPSSQKVLRNAYWLLALSMVPTVAGAWLGVNLGFNAFGGSPWLGALLFLGVSFAFIYGIEKTKDSAWGVALMLAFTGFMGVMLSGLLQVALQLRNGAELIALAAGGTGVIFAALATVATVSKRDFSFLGKFLFVGLILLIVASLANLWLQLPLLHVTLAAIGVLMFSGFILYDVSRVVQGGERNYISAALSIYLDVFNLFVNLLQLLMALAGERD